MIEVFRAKSVITINPSQPRAEVIAVRNGKILETGTIQSIEPWLINNNFIMCLYHLLN